jgi:hypothetical protein
MDNGIIFPALSKNRLFLVGAMYGKETFFGGQ